MTNQLHISDLNQWAEAVADDKPDPETKAWLETEMTIEKKARNLRDLIEKRKETDAHRNPVA